LRRWSGSSCSARSRRSPRRSASRWSPAAWRRTGRSRTGRRLRAATLLYLDQNYLSGIAKGKPAFAALEPVLHAAVARGAVAVPESPEHERESAPRPDLGLLELLRGLSRGRRLPPPDPEIVLRLRETIARELPERAARESDEADLRALAAALPACRLVTCDAFMADVIRRTRLDLRHRAELFTGRRGDVERLARRLEALGPEPDAYLPGHWTVERAVEDAALGAGRFDGEALFAEDGGRLTWTESGRLRLGRYDGPATRKLLVVPSGEGWEVRFEDGRPFHPLDLGHGTVAHPCGDDLYDGEYVVAGPDEMRVRWRVRGPAKDQRIDTVYRRR
jgi:hypothetical protein